MERSGHILQSLAFGNGTDVVEIYRADRDREALSPGVYFSARVTSLQVNARVKDSSPEGDTISNFYSDRSLLAIPAVQSLVKESNSLILSVKNSPEVAEWEEIGSLPLINSRGIESFSINLLEFFPLDYLASQAVLGVNVSDGLIGGDRLTIFGGYVENFDYKRQYSYAYTNNVNVADVSEIVLQPNPDRDSLNILNTGNETVYLSLTADASLEIYFAPIPSNYLLQDIKWSGIVSAICQSGKSSELQITEQIK